MAYWRWLAISFYLGCGVAALAEPTAAPSSTAPGAAVVVDNFNHTVGQLLQPGQVLVTIDSTPVSLDIEREFFPITKSEQVQFFHRARDCAGDRFLHLGVPIRGIIDNSGVKIYYAKLVATRSASRSIETFPPNADVRLPGMCQNASRDDIYLAPLRSISLFDLGFSPPYRVVRP